MNVWYNGLWVVEKTPICIALKFKTKHLTPTPKIKITNASTAIYLADTRNTAGCKCANGKFKSKFPVVAHTN